MKSLCLSLMLLFSSSVFAMSDDINERSCIVESFTESTCDEYAREEIVKLKNEFEAYKKDPICDPISIQRFASKTVSLGALGYIFNCCVKNDMQLSAFLVLLAVVSVAQNS